MREELQRKVEQSYQRAEERASLYFQSLLERVQQKSYVSILINDFKAWKHDHIRYHSVISFFSKKQKKRRFLESIDPILNGWTKQGN